ncbi:MAG: isocitrate lyase/phosphoenolpyruvate mutase family protein [Humibacillus sp.]|nr:isocitrate lyase/phosphoenolpyruvate mutase family protein [Humibacillus sp.]MDN5777922.1 isocitrate lyase/phosphoenolpyruvate mutase family protein [Humibacillus sp.]
MNQRSTRSPRDQAEHLRRLHHDDAILVLVNVWDAASARVVAATPGCSAIATASAAIAATHGYEDGENIPVDLMIDCLRRVCQAVELPVTADLERGYTDVGATTSAALDAGAVGINLEDDLCATETMEERIREAVDTGQAHGIPLVVNARTDVFLLRPDAAPEQHYAEAAERGRRYLDAGADCVFVPGCTAEQHIRDLVAQFGPGRLSLLAVPGTADAGTLQEWGVARLSHGPFPHRRTLQALDAYAREHAELSPKSPRQG